MSKTSNDVSKDGGLLIYCCHQILMSRLFDHEWEFVEEAMKKNFRGKWTGMIDAKPSDEEAFDWTADLARLPGLLKMDAWEAQRKGSILLLAGTLKKAQLPLDQELMRKPVAEAMNNFFDRVAAETKTDISDEVKISYWRTYDDGETGETVVRARLSKELSLDIPIFRTIDTPNGQHQ